ncbi:MAG: DeoR/GlpR family DNA-binding transcription regulator [Alkalispirochaeta sp.]
MVENRKQRLSRLLNKVKVEQQVSIEELSDYFGVSTATIRRDIKELEKQQVVVQTVGGGVIYQMELTGAVGPHSAGQAIAEKIRIAEYCTELVRDHDDVLIGPGTTTFLAGKIMSGITDRQFRIITNSLELAVETSVAENIRTVILGGEVWHKHSVGPEAGYEYFRHCHHQHTLVLSADGVDRDQGITVFESQVVPTIQQMIEVSNRIILAVDARKFGRARFNRISEIDAVSVVVTDDSAPQDYVDFIRNHGIQVVLV